MFHRSLASPRATLALALLLLLSLGSMALTPAADAATPASFQLAIGGVRDACTGAHLGGAVLTFTEAVEHPPAPIRVTTNPGGQFAIELPPGHYSVAALLDDYGQPGNTDGDLVSVITVRTGLVNHFVFVLHPPSPC